MFHYILSCAKVPQAVLYCIQFKLNQEKSFEGIIVKWRQIAQKHDIMKFLVFTDTVFKKDFKY